MSLPHSNFPFWIWIFVGFVLLITLIETLIYLVRKDLKLDLDEMRKTIFIFVIHVFSQIMAFFLISKLTIQHQLPSLKWDLGSPSLNWIASWIICDFTGYWIHRFSHQWKLLWAHHSVHHSILQITYLSTNRLGPFGFFTFGWILNFLPIFLGVSPLIQLQCNFFILTYMILLHTEWKQSWGWLELVLNTPTHHRIHHWVAGSKDSSNFGSSLIIWDRIFGTFREKKFPEESHPYGWEGGTPLKVSEIVLNGWRDLLPLRKSKIDPNL